MAAKTVGKWSFVFYAIETLYALNALILLSITTTLTTLLSNVLRASSKKTNLAYMYVAYCYYLRNSMIDAQTSRFVFWDRRQPDSTGLKSTLPLLP